MQSCDPKALSCASPRRAAQLLLPTAGAGRQSGGLCPLPREAAAHLSLRCGRRKKEPCGKAPRSSTAVRACSPSAHGSPVPAQAVPAEQPGSSATSTRHLARVVRICAGLVRCVRSGSSPAGAKAALGDAGLSQALGMFLPLREGAQCFDRT